MLSRLAIVNGKILTASKDPEIPFFIEKGIVLVEEGKIKYVGSIAEIPEDTTILDASGKIVTPGLIDAHCHIGIFEDGAGWAGDDTNESSDPNTAEVRALDGINPMDVAFKDAIASGVTCVQVDPGSANIIGGETLVMKTWGSPVVDELILKRPSGLKAALGENPKRVYGSQHKMPTTRMGNAAILRKALTEARDYMRKKELGKDKPDKLPDLNLRHESIARVLRKEIPLRVHCHRADDIMTALRIAKEFDIDISLEHCTEGDKVAQAVRDSGVPVTMGPSLTDKSKLEVRDIGFAAPVALSKAGVKLAIITDHPVLPIQYLRISAGLAVREGMDEEYAILAVTRYAAEIAGVGDRVGSLEPGKDADLVIWSKDPLEYDAKVEQTFINGKPVYEKPRSNS
ncbi:MAG: amidohydrolase [Candidatus Fermentithermobacillus carboniphilus]|uniref:Amidohydrolase n=1 Tax=Candidatus Fermentithermobacillus carboniphilus TaxID=3085328 RepID=A0AAT9LBC8_9FIRM|nr:MAG: amidohydrolase [Candidatus Fermentithermobacillus carboniphilus]